MKDHPFFREIDWEMLAQKDIDPPFKPRVMGESDISNIDRVIF